MRVLWSGYWTALGLVPVLGGMVVSLIGAAEINAAIQALARAGWTPEGCWTRPACAEYISRAARWYLLPIGLTAMIAGGLAMRPIVLHVAPLQVGQPLQERPTRR